MKNYGAYFGGTALTQLQETFIMVECMSSAARFCRYPRRSRDLYFSQIVLLCEGYLEKVLLRYMDSLLDI